MIVIINKYYWPLPPFSKIRIFTSSWSLGKASSLTDLVRAFVTKDEKSFSSTSYKEEATTTLYNHALIFRNSRSKHSPDGTAVFLHKKKEHTWTHTQHVPVVISNSDHNPTHNKLTLVANSSLLTDSLGPYLLYTNIIIHVCDIYK